MTKITITEALSRVRDSGKRAADGSRYTELVAAICVPGYHVRQGDVILTCAENPMLGKAITERQLAPGSTQGSRHVAEGDVKLYAPTQRGPLEGPTLIPGSDGCRITHPEHRHYGLPAGTAWRVTYERDLEQEEIARVTD